MNEREEPIEVRRPKRPEYFDGDQVVLGNPVPCAGERFGVAVRYPTAEPPARVVAIVAGAVTMLLAAVRAPNDPPFGTI